MVEKLKNGQRVKIHSLGKGNAFLECEGIIRGIANDGPFPRTYIVEIDKPNDWFINYDCITMTEVCLKAL